MEARFKNPMNKAIKVVLCNMKAIKVKSFVDIIPAFFMFISYGIALVICIVFWFYGLFSVIEQIFRFLIKTTASSMTQSGNSKVENVPLVISIGVFSICWMPFAVLVFPLFILGYFAGLFYKHDK